jgi:hypothetical protein
VLAQTDVTAVATVDFMYDASYGGRAFRTLNVLDEGNREALGIEVGTGINLRREGWLVNHKRVLRLYREEGLNECSTPPH